ncbi:MAG: glucosamine-6-phosphate deaminase [Treponema sp.]|jgi:glucosamine-6-phosphate deaminase|nr:glucosamine-6-phosphate deaminase [Treponema sp.]
MRLRIHSNYEEASRWAAAYIAAKINSVTSKKGTVTLGLPTGSTPLGVYSELIALYQAGKVSFENVTTFNMDEYTGLAPDHPSSYHYFMWDTFFSHINIDKKNVHILDGMAKDADAECEAYEEAMARCGVDLFLGGAGEDGHIAFNEPGSSLSSRTRVKTLAPGTLRANSRFFGGDLRRVPKTAMTVGVATIMDAREVLIIVSGANKARALRAAVEDGVNHLCPLSILQMHRHGIIVCDEDAAGELGVNTVNYFKSIEM